MRKVVLIDDEASIRETVAELLSLHDYDVQTAFNGESGIEVIKKHQPDVILCDIMMPGISGWDVLKSVREMPDATLTPFLFLSAKNDLESIREGMNIGADDYVVKPFKLKDLLHAVDTKVTRFKALTRHIQNQQNNFPAHFSRYGFHEFNTPMNGLLGGFDFLLDYGHDLNSTERTELLSQMRLSACRLKRSYTNLMLYVKFMRGEPVYSFKYTSSTEEVFAKVQQRLRDFYPDAAYTLFLENARVRLRAEALELVMYELLDNAIKFSPLPAKVTVHGKLNASASKYTFSVTDEGPGMTSEEIAQIGPMVQFNRAKHEQQGWGLGLFLVKSICEANGLGFDMESSPKGTRVSVDFPA